MPIYEYRCQACGEQFDKLVRSINRPPQEINCPACDSPNIRRLISAPMVRTAGAGEATRSEAGAADSTAEKPVFGRKELEAATRKKAERKERAKYNDWD